MDIQSLNKYLGNVDIYLLDQVMKHRYEEGDVILDAGCGKGRNIYFLNQFGFDIEACDIDNKFAKNLKSKFSDIKIIQADLSNLPYEPNRYDHIICNAVLHFAKSDQHFYAMMNELNRVLKKGGSLFIRMTSEFGLNSYEKLENGQCKLLDGTTRFLLNNDHILYIKTMFNFIEPIKTVNVDDVRCMSTLILKKIL